jgi:hypothetical protein
VKDWNERRYEVGLLLSSGLKSRPWLNSGLDVDFVPLAQATQKAPPAGGEATLERAGTGPVPAAESCVVATLKTFFSRKIVKKSAPREVSEKKLAKYKAALVKDFDAAMGAGAGDAWFAEYAQPVVDGLLK